MSGRFRGRVWDYSSCSVGWNCTAARSSSRAAKGRTPPSPFGCPCFSEAMTIPQRILWQVAAGADLVIAIATAVTYGRVYDSAKRRDLKHLETYVTERARREE